MYKETNPKINNKTYIFLDFTVLICICLFYFLFPTPSPSLQHTTPPYRHPHTVYMYLITNR